MRRNRMALVATAFAMLALASLAANGADDEAIKAAALDYAEAWHNGDAERMERALHPELLKRRIVTDVLTGIQSVQALDAPTLIRATRDGVGKGAVEGPLSFRVAILDQHGDMAVVRVVSPLYVDYLQMVRWEDRWVILSILWGALDVPLG
jgi:hypothetical protein